MARRLIFILIIGTLMAPAVHALADRAAVGDPRDTRGPLDVRRLSHSHGPTRNDGEKTVEFLIATHTRWANRRLRCGNLGSKCRSMFEIFITTDDDDRIERFIQVYQRDGRLHAPVHADTDVCLLLDFCLQGSRRIGDAKVWRLDDRTLQVRVRLSLLGEDLRRYGWNVRMGFFTNTPCPGHSAQSNHPRFEYECFDYAPEPPGRFLFHRV